MGTYDSYQSNNIIDQDLQDTERLPQLTDTAWRYQDYPAYATSPQQYSYGDYEQAEAEPSTRDKLLRRMAIITSTLAIISAGAVVGKNYLASHGSNMAQPAATVSENSVPGNTDDSANSGSEIPGTPTVNNDGSTGNNQSINLPSQPDPKNVLPSFETLKPTDYKCYLIDDKGNKVEKVYHFDDDKYRQQRYTNSDYTADIKRSSVDDIVNMYHEFTGNSGGFQDVMMYEQQREGSESSPVMTALANAGYCYDSNIKYSGAEGTLLATKFNRGVYGETIYRGDQMYQHDDGIFITSNDTVDLNFHLLAGHEKRLVHVDKPFVIYMRSGHDCPALLIESDELPTVREIQTARRSITKTFLKAWGEDRSIYDFDTGRFANGGEFYLPPQGDVSESELDQVDSN